MFLNLCESIKEEFEDKLKDRVELKKLTKTYLETLVLLEDNKSLEEVSQIRDLGLVSILSHLKLLKQHQKITEEQKDKLLEPIKIDKNVLSWIEEGLELKTLKELKQDLYLYEYLKDLNEK